MKCNSKNQKLFQETFSKSFGKFENKRIIKRNEWYKNKKIQDDFLYLPLDMLVKFLLDKMYVDRLLAI